MIERYWLKNYPKDVPADINPDAYTSLVDFFSRCCKKYAALPAFAHMGTVLTYTEIDRLSDAFACFLVELLNIKKGTRLAIMLPNLLQFPIAFIGGLKAGCILVNINPLYTAREIEYQLNDAGVEIIITLVNFASILQQALPKTAVKHVMITEVGDLFSPLKSIFINYMAKYTQGKINDWSIPKAIFFKEVIKKGKQLKLNPIKLTNTDIALLQYTGGTTGISKGAVLTHRNLVANVEQATAWAKSVQHEREEISITALPLYHIFALTVNCLCVFKLGGLSVLITNPRDRDNLIKEMSKYKFTIIAGVNTLFKALLNHPIFSFLDFSALRLSLGGGMAIQESIAKAWQKVTGCPLIEAYGLTETSPAASINPLDLPAYNGSVGLPISSTEITIRDEQGHILPPGLEGELCIKGPQVMREYWKHPDETERVFFPDGAFRTGDIACMDEQGYIRILERKKDMISVSGFKVYPNEIEQVIASHPGVLEVGVAGTKSTETGEAVCAFIVKKEPQLTLEEISDWCKKQLSPYKVPRFIEFRSELPKSNVGKVLRKELKLVKELNDAPVLK